MKGRVILDDLGPHECGRLRKESQPMVVSSRVIVAVGLGLVGLGLVVAPATGQQAQDNGARRTSGGPAATAAAPATPKAPDPAIIGWVDMGAVFKGYDKVKVQGEEFKVAVQGKQKELVKYTQEAQQESEMLAKMTPGSVDYKKHEDNITQLKAKYEAGRESAEREFTLREAEMLAALYKDIASMVGRVAKYRGMTFVVRVNNDPITGANPNAAMMAIERDVVYADKSLEITSDVIFNLNREYKAAGGGAVNSTSAAPAPTNPRGN
jgi:outer membrane protein